MQIGWEIGWRDFIFRTICAVLLCYMTWKALNIIGLLMTLYVVPRFYGPYLVEMVPWIKRAADAQVLMPLHGKYYSFDGRQIRFYRIDGEFWVVLDDIRHFITPKLTQEEVLRFRSELSQLSGTRIHILKESALLNLLNRRVDQNQFLHTPEKTVFIRFNKWILIEALPNLKRLPRSAFED